MSHAALLTLDQQRRYARQIMLPEIGVAGQAKLLGARVLVVGAGGLGSALISYLAAAGVGHIGIIDDDRVELSNLGRQIIHETGDIGRLKVESARDRVAELNPDVSVTTYPFAITAENAGEVLSGSHSLPPRGRVGEGPSGPAIAHHAPHLTSPLRGEEYSTTLTPHDSRLTTPYTVVADGCDNFASRFAVNAACVKLGMPLVSAAIAGWHGQVMSVLPGTPCYQCFVNPDAPEANTCRESGVIGPLAGIIGSMQALEVIRVILGTPALAGRVALFDGRTNTQRIASLTRDAACAVC